jgi:hypothetical protein
MNWKLSELDYRYTYMYVVNCSILICSPATTRSNPGQRLHSEHREPIIVVVRLRVPASGLVRKTSTFSPSCTSSLFIILDLDFCGDRDTLREGERVLVRVDLSGCLPGRIAPTEPGEILEQFETRSSRYPG